MIASHIAQNDPSLQLVLVEAGIDASSDPLMKKSEVLLPWPGRISTTTTKPVLKPIQITECIYTAAVGGIIGGSILNYGLSFRGDARDYDQLAKLVGDERWSYKGLLPYFKNSEHSFITKQAPKHRGSDGAIRITSVFKSDPKASV